MRVPNSVLQLADTLMKECDLTSHARLYTSLVLQASFKHQREAVYCVIANANGAAQDEMIELMSEYPKDRPSIRRLLLETNRARKAGQRQR